MTKKSALTPRCHIKLCGVNDTASSDSAMSMTLLSLTTSGINDSASAESCKKISGPDGVES